jgi:hypothetical protein
LDGKTSGTAVLEEGIPFPHKKKKFSTFFCDFFEVFLLFLCIKEVVIKEVVVVEIAVKFEPELTCLMLISLSISVEKVWKVVFAVLAVFTVPVFKSFELFIFWDCFLVPNLEALERLDEELFSSWIEDKVACGVCI